MPKPKSTPLLDLLEAEKPRPDGLKFAGDPAMFSQDESGQWWYTFGARKVRTRAVVMTCSRCGCNYVVAPFHRPGLDRPSAFCSRSCAIRTMVEERDTGGPKHYRWQGGRTVHRNGYVLIYAPEHPARKRNGKYVAEHRLVMEKMLGRYLTDREQVHHKNGIKSDNRPENLELWTTHHPYGVRAGDDKHCPTCTCCNPETTGASPMDPAKMTEAEIEAMLQELGAEQEAVREKRVALKAELDKKIHARNAAAVLGSVSPEVKHAMVQAATLEAKAEAPRPQPATTQPPPAPVAPKPAAPQPAPVPAAPHPAPPKP